MDNKEPAAFAILSLGVLVFIFIPAAILSSREDSELKRSDGRVSTTISIQSKLFNPSHQRRFMAQRGKWFDRLPTFDL